MTATTTRIAPGDRVRVDFHGEQVDPEPHQGKTGTVLEVQRGNRLYHRRALVRIGPRDVVLAVRFLERLP